MYISSPLELVVCYVRLLQKMTEAELYTVHKGVYVPTHLHPPESLKYCEEFTFRPDDILIVTYPKSGEFAEFYLFIIALTLYNYHSVKRHSADSSPL